MTNNKIKIDYSIMTIIYYPDTDGLLEAILK